MISWLVKLPSPELDAWRVDTFLKACQQVKAASLISLDLPSSVLREIVLVQLWLPKGWALEAMHIDMGAPRGFVGRFGSG